MSEKEINEIKSQIGVLKRKLDEANSRLEAAHMRHAGLKVGDRIIVHRDTGDVEAIVKGWAVEWFGPGRPIAIKVKKNDGTRGAASAGIFHKWSLKTAQE